MSLEFNGLLDVSFDSQAGYWDDEEDLECSKCGKRLNSFNELNRGCCDECWREVNEEDMA